MRDYTTSEYAQTDPFRAAGEVTDWFSLALSTE